MKLIASLYIVALLFVGCSSSAQDPDAARTEIKVLEDSISNVSMKLQPGQKIDTAMMGRLKSKLVNYYQSFPENEYAPEYLDKLHMLSIGVGDYETGIGYAETLLNDYKVYINRPMILESMANAYDMFVQPRDTSKVRYYNTLLLKENPKMDKEKKEEIRFRLKHIDLTIDELIDLQVKSIMEK
ncbi:MAG: hypothetical protein QNL61_09570 [Crocinitomicaceae bacterium]